MESNVKALMEARGMTVRDMVELTRLSSATVIKARDERISTCSLSSLEKVAGALHVHVCDLLDEG